MVSTLKSNVLIIGHPYPNEVRYGADFISTIEESPEKIFNPLVNTLVIYYQPALFSSIKNLLQSLKTQNSEKQIILISPQIDDNELIQMNELFPIFKALPSVNVDELELAIYQANEKFNFLQQNKELYNLFSQQNKSLESLNLELEKKIQERQTQLEKTQDRLKHTQSYSTVINNLLIALQKTTTIKEMENTLVQHLKPIFKISKLNIEIGSGPPSLPTKSQVLRYIGDLILEEKILGQLNIQFVNPINGSQKNFLSQVCEITALMLDKLLKLNESNRIKNQWEKTFNSISDSVALTNSHFDIISANNSFFEQSLPHPTSQNLFEVFFAEAKNQLPENIYHMDTIQFSILLNGNVKHYYLRKHKIPLQHSSEFIFMILIRDVTSQKQLENQVLESSKLAELGTIGSSIAHELNNPLGGILSFAQLIKMDLDKDDPFYKDIDLIEVSALKCKDIIENLLGFSRTSEEGENQSYSLEETIQKAIKIVNLQTASKNIQIDFISHSDEYLEHKGNQNQMVQALCNILQNSIDAFDEQKKTSSALTQNIRIEVKGGHKNQITITDNGPGIPAKVRSKIFNPLFSTKKSKTKSGLGLTVSYQIVKNQGGHLEVFSQPKAGTSVRITL